MTGAIRAELIRQRALLAGTATTLEAINAATHWLLAAGVPQAWLVAQSRGQATENLEIVDPDDERTVPVHVGTHDASVDVRLWLSVHEPDPDPAPVSDPLPHRGLHVFWPWDYALGAWDDDGYRGQPFDCAIPFGLRDPMVVSVYRRLRLQGLSVRDATATAPAVAATRP